MIAKGIAQHRNHHQHYDRQNNQHQH